MSEDRRKILEMLSKGQITVPEAERLMASLEKDSPAGGAGSGSTNEPKAQLKYVRVLVTEEGGRGANVNIRVPMQLLRSGVKLAGLIPPHARDRVNIALHKEGLPFDLNQIKPENLEEFLEQLGDLTIDVDDRNKQTKVRVFCE
jgi:hypothetical protein